VLRSLLVLVVTLWVLHIVEGVNLVIELSFVLLACFLRESFKVSSWYILDLLLLRLLNIVQILISLLSLGGQWLLFLLAKSSQAMNRRGKRQTASSADFAKD
jgi:hypothetical protein